jgi:hypothetical protein
VQICAPPRSRALLVREVHLSYVRLEEDVRVSNSVRSQKYRALAVSSALVPCLLTPSFARADDAPVFELAGKASYASRADTLGLGVRLGYSYVGFYGGLSLVDYLPVGGTNSNSVVAEAEVGYGLKISFVTIRPLLGFGFGFADGPECPNVPAGQTVVCGSNGTFILQPGGLVQLGFGHLILGAYASALIPFGTGEGALFEVGVQGGVRF